MTAPKFLQYKFTKNKKETNVEPGFAQRMDHTGVAKGKFL